MEKTKEYTNGDVTVVWKPGLCIHSAKCVHGMPDVFKPKDKPWIQAEGANSEQLMKTIDRCPSGALSYYREGDTELVGSSAGTSPFTVEILEDGPLMVSGPFVVTYRDGRTEEKKRNTAFCRCGQTGNVPFCDGSHNQEAQ